MKRVHKLTGLMSLLVVALGFQGVLWADYCKGAEIEKLYKQGDLYTFVVEVECEQYTSLRSIGEATERFASAISQDPAITVFNKDNNYIEGKYRGYYYDMLERRHTKSGTLHINSYAKVMDDGFDDFIYDVQSYRVSGKGDADNTRYVRRHLKAEWESDGELEIDYTMTLQVEKPWYVDEDSFVKEVYKSLKPEVEQAAYSYAGLLR